MQPQGLSYTRYPWGVFGKHTNSYLISTIINYIPSCRIYLLTHPHSNPHPKSRFTRTVAISPCASHRTPVPTARNSLPSLPTLIQYMRSKVCLLSTMPLGVKLACCARLWRKAVFRIGKMKNSGLVVGMELRMTTMRRVFGHELERVEGEDEEQITKQLNDNEEDRRTRSVELG